MLKRESSDFTDKREVAKFINSGPHLVEGSPVNVASSIKAPVLLIHGDLDTNVFVTHSDKMSAELRKTTGSVEYLRYKGLDHQLADGDVRAQMFAKLAVHLSRTIGK